MSDGRLHQDSAFSLPELAGCQVTAVLGVVKHAAPDDQPFVINMRLEDEQWHRFFLDAGLAFWSRSSQLVDDDPEDDEWRLVDYGAIHLLVGETLRSAEARPCIPGGSAEVIVHFESGRFIRLTLSEPAALDSISVFQLGSLSSA